MKARLSAGIVLLALLHGSFECAARPLHNPPRVGVIFNTARMSQLQPDSLTSTAALSIQEEIVKAAFKPGKDVLMYWRSIESNWSRYDSVVDELLKLDIDILVISGNDEAARNLARKAPELRIVVASSGGAESLGLASLARPGGNITGVEIDLNFLKMLEMLREIVPTLSRVAFLGDDKVRPWGETVPVSEARRQSAARDVQVLDYGIDTIDEVEAALAHAKQRGAQAVVVCCALFYLPESQRRVHAAAAKNKLPAIHWRLSAVETGGLAAYGIEQDLNFRKAGAYVAKILKGANPGDLPVERLYDLKLHLNKSAAKAIGLTLPPTLLLRAHKVID